MLKAACVIHLSHRVLVGHLLRLDEVAAAQRDAVHADLAGGFIHQSLHDVNRLGPACAAIGTRGSRVGDHRPVAKIDGLNVVHAGLHPGANQRLNRHTHAHRIGAHVGQRMHAQRQNFAVGIQRQGGAGLHIAAMGSR